MAVTLDLTGVAVAQVAVSASPLSELMACLHVLAEPDHHWDSLPWRDRVGDQLSSGLQADLTRFAPLWARRRSRMLLPLATPVPVDFSVELERVAALPLETFTDHTAHTVHGGDIDTVGLATDPARHLAYVDACEHRSFSRGELARSLVADAERFRAELLALLQRCRTEFFDEQWSRVHGRLDEEVAGLQAQHHPSAVDVVCAVSPSAVRMGDTCTVRFDKLQDLRVSPGARAIVLIPTIFGRPHTIVRGDKSLPVVVQFPVQSGAHPETVVDVQRRLTVLADSNRLALCRHLVNETMTTSELARRTGMPLSQVSRHLSRLREAGLLQSERDGRLVHHRLDVTVLMQLGPRLIRAIVQ